MSLKITHLIKPESVSYSCEVTPDIDINKLMDFEPLFYSITWHAKLHQCKDLDISPLKLAFKLKEIGKNVLLHISCDLLKKGYVDELLECLQVRGICNLFIVLGESFDATSSDFLTTQDLIKYVREKTGNYFCIGVAGYPNRDDKLRDLKEKVNCGADFIITQALFESSQFIDFVEKCLTLNITIPVFPGLFAFESMDELQRFTNLCKIKISDSFLCSIETQEKHFSGSIVIINVINELRDSKYSIKHFHFFTLNRFLKVRNVMNSLSS